ncbi:MAG: ECF transporter S component [Clostridia bacterium]|nr:ECF transporter S component [Clostridia bacterium]
MSSVKQKKISVLTLAMGGVMAALVCLATLVFKLPVPVTQGYIHLGDALVLVSAAVLGPTGIAAAAVGSMLADLLGGYFTYLIPTFLIKGLVALVAYLGLGKQHPFWMQLLVLMAAEAVMVLGYFLAECLLYGAAAAAGAVLPNVVQGIGGVVFGALLIPVFRRIVAGLKGR